MNTPETYLEPVHQGAFTSRARDEYGADASSPITLMNDTNAPRVKRALIDYQDSGATQFGAATFGANPYRATGNVCDFEYDSSTCLQLPPEYIEANRKGVQIASDVSGRNVPALIAPVTDTIGRHDEQWKNLGSNQVDWAIQRHLPQAEELLSNPNVVGVWAEAVRYKNEAIALAMLSCEFKAQLLVVAFRLEPTGDFGDPEHRRASISEIQEELQSIATETKVITGINCSGVTAIQNRLSTGDSAGVVYPNTNDDAKATPEQLQRLEELYKLGGTKTPEEVEEQVSIENTLVTSKDEYLTTWKLARERDPNCTISACCGATPEIVSWAHEFHHALQSIH